MRYYTAARALRPETAHELAHLLDRMGRGDEAVAIFRDLTRRRPNSPRHLGCLGSILERSGRAAEVAPILDQAIAAVREEIRDNPDDDSPYSILGLILCDVKHDYSVRRTHSFRRSGSIPMTSRFTATLASPCSGRRSGNRPSLNGARRST